MPTPISTQITTATVPADVRAAGPEAVTLFHEALGFEEILVRRLAAALTESSDSEDGEDGADGATATIRKEFLPDSFAKSITAAGGLGLARDLALSLTRKVGA